MLKKEYIGVLHTSKYSFLLNILINRMCVSIKVLEMPNNKVLYKVEKRT